MKETVLKTLIEMLPKRSSRLSLSSMSFELRKLFCLNAIFIECYEISRIENQAIRTLKGHRGPALRFG